MSGYNPYRNIDNATNNIQINKKGNYFNNRLFNLSLFGRNYKENFVDNIKGTHKNQDLSVNDSLGNQYSMFSKKVHALMQEKENVALLSAGYQQKLPILREYAVKGEIAEYVSKMANEIICYEDNNFCTLKKLPEQYPKALKNRVNEIYSNLYNYFQFDDGTTAWDLARDWLVEGFICKEIVYDSKGKNIIGFHSLDPLKVIPIIDEETGLKLWVLNPEDEEHKVIFLDAEIIYISYSGSSNFMETSYVEPMIKPYNELKSIERSRILFNLQQSMMHKKFIIPTHGLSPNDAEQEILDLISDYKDNITFDDTTGVMYIDGQKDIPYSKEYWFPDGSDGSPQVDIMDQGGHDLNENSMLVWFKNAFKHSSKFPLSRSDNTTGGGNVYISSNELTHDDYNFQQYVNRLRTIFKNIILKPLKTQVLMEFPEYQNDTKFLNDLDIEYVMNSELIKAKRLANQAAMSEIVATLQNNFKREDDKPVLHWKTILKYYMGDFFDEDMLKENEGYWNEEEGDVGAGEGAEGPGGGGDDDFGDLDDDLGGDLDEGGDLDIDLDEGGTDEPIDDTPEE